MNYTDNLTYNISVKPVSTAQVSLLCNNTGGINIAFTAAGGVTDTLVMPYYSVINRYEIITPRGTEVTNNYIGAYLNNTKVVRSDFTTNRVNAFTSTSTYFQATIFYTGQTGQILLLPKITYIPGIDAFGNFLNISMQTSFMKNNTPHYILDTNSNNWFLCPAYLVPDLTTIYTIQCLYTGVAGGAGNTSNFTGPSYQYLFSDISTAFFPTEVYIVNNTSVIYTVFSSTSSLEYYGMIINYTNYTNLSNITTSIIYSNNTTSITGGTLNLTVSYYGKYEVTTWFKKSGQNLYYPFIKTFYVMNTTGLMQAGDTLQTSNIISGWAFYFVAVVVSMLVMGFASRYTIDGAGVVGVVTLWGFTMLWPNASLVPSLPMLTPLTATILTTIAVFGALYIRYRASTGGG
jgi:hypothetical protein